jgi:hypothetical protein
MQHKIGEHSRRPAGDGAGRRLPAGRQVGEGTAQALIPRRVVAALAAAGILGPVVFAVVAVVQGLLRPGVQLRGGSGRGAGGRTQRLGTGPELRRPRSSHDRLRGRAAAGRAPDPMGRGRPRVGSAHRRPANAVGISTSGLTLARMAAIRAAVPWPSCPVSMNLARQHLADLRRATSGETPFSGLSHLIWSAVAILSPVSHSIWSAMAVLWRRRHWAKGQLPSLTGSGPEGGHWWQQLDSAGRSNRFGTPPRR